MEYQKLLKKYQRLEKDFMQLIANSVDACKYCKNHIECKGKDCPKYVQGKDCYDDKRCHYDWVWSCEDFNFGTCDLLEHTPCNGCIDNNLKGFEWKGNKEE